MQVKTPYLMPLASDVLCNSGFVFCLFVCLLILEKQRSACTIHFVILFFFLWATLQDTRDLSSPTRDQTRTPCSGSMES